MSNPWWISYCIVRPFIYGYKLHENKYISVIHCRWPEIVISVQPQVANMNFTTVLMMSLTTKILVPLWTRLKLRCFLVLVVLVVGAHLRSILYGKHGLKNALQKYTGVRGSGKCCGNGNRWVHCLGQHTIRGLILAIFKRGLFSIIYSHNCQNKFLRKKKRTTAAAVSGQATEGTVPKSGRGARADISVATHSQSVCDLWGCVCVAGGKALTLNWWKCLLVQLIPTSCACVLS